MKKIDHIGIAVKDIKEATRNYEKLLRIPSDKEEDVLEEGVKTVFFSLGETKIELLGAITKDSVINKFIERKGEGIHHIALAVKDIKESIEYYKRNGYELINTTAKKGADNKLICFLHPKDTNGVLLELCQEIN